MVGEQARYLPTPLTHASELLCRFRSSISVDNEYHSFVVLAMLVVCDHFPRLFWQVGSTMLVREMISEPQHNNICRAYSFLRGDFAYTQSP